MKVNVEIKNIAAGIQAEIPAYNFGLQNDRIGMAVKITLVTVSLLAILAVIHELIRCKGYNCNPLPLDTHCDPELCVNPEFFANHRFPLDGGGCYCPSTLCDPKFCADPDFFAHHQFQLYSNDCYCMAY